MSTCLNDGDAGESTTVLEWIDAVADRFEAAWKQEGTPRIPNFLGAETGRRRSALLEELVKVDLVYRWRSGDRRGPEDYLDEFPELLGADGSLPGPLLAHAQRLRERFDGPGPQPPAVPDLPRSLGKFRLLALLGRGAFGAVYQARDEELDRLVAVKVPHAGRFATAEEEARFLREARSAARLAHPAIVPVHEIAHADGLPYLVCEYVEGRTLARELSERRFGFREAAELTARIADALAYAHERGVVHRDVNPRNILLDTAGRPHVTDFGLARREEGSLAVTLEGEVLGTPAYMAPEQAAGEPRADGRSDVYSLGVVLYELLTGERPFRGSVRMLLHQVLDDEPRPPRRLNDHVPRDLETVCLKCLEKEPRRRYPTAAELAADLRRFLAGEPVRARRAAAWERGLKWAKRRPAGAAAAAALALAAVSMLLVLWYRERLRATEEVAAVEVRAARETAAVQEYYALLNRVRERHARPRPGWTWAGLEDLRRATRLPTAVRNPLELRNEAAACLAGVDLREAAVLAKDFDAYCLAFSPDGRRLAVGQNKGLRSCSVLVYDMERRQLLHDYAFPTSPVDHLATGVRSLAFSPDGRWLVAGTRGSGEVHAWDSSRDRPERITWKAHADEVHGLVFRPDGRSLVTCSRDRTVKRWDVAAGWRAVGSWETDDSCSCLARSPDGKLLACAAWSRVCLLDAATLRPVPDGSLPGDSQVCFSPDGRTLAVNQLWRIDLIEVRSRKVFRSLYDAELPAAHEDNIKQLAFSPDGSLLVSGAYDRTVKLWEVATGRLLAKLPAPGTGNIYPLFSPDGRHLAVTGDRQTVLYELGGLHAETVVAQHPYPVRAVAYAPDGAALACVAGERVVGPVGRGALTLWDADGGWKAEHDLSELPHQDPRTTVPLAFHPDGSWLAHGYSLQTFQLCDLRKAERRAPAEAWTALSLSFTPNGQTLWSAGHRGVEVAAWSVPDLTPLHRWANDDPVATTRTGRNTISSVAAGRAWVVAGSWDATTKLLRTRDGGLEREWPGPGGPVLCVALSGDEGLAASGSEGGGVRVARVPGGEVIADLEAHREGVTAVAFRPDDRLLATASRDRTVRLWTRDGEAFREVLTLHFAGGPVAGLAFRLDGRRLAVLVKNEPAVRLWHLDRLRERLAAVGLDW